MKMRKAGRINIPAFLLSIFMVSGILASDGIHRDAGIAYQSFDLVELNHFYDGDGKLVFDQLIFYRWQKYSIDAEELISTGIPGLDPIKKQIKDSGYRYQVMAWKLVNNKSMLDSLHKDINTGLYSMSWNDGDTFRVIKFPAFKESWTQHDPEIEERKFLDKDLRPDLLKLKKPESFKPDTLGFHP